MDAFSRSLTDSDFHLKGSLKSLHPNPEELHCFQLLFLLVSLHLIPAVPTPPHHINPAAMPHTKIPTPSKEGSRRTEKEDKEGLLFDLNLLLGFLGPGTYGQALVFIAA